MPTSPDWTSVDAAFAQALDLDGPEREAYLEALDPAVRAALAPLLRDALREFPLLDRPEEVVAPLAADDDGPGVAEGVRVGPYQIGELVGEGGMGRVYRARRADGAFDQTVAVKVVRQSLALAGSDVAGRLRRERALLATLDHPGIARLVDGGETEDGVPYLVTEFVDGAPITDWAAARDLDVRARVQLLIDVARSVDHAHRRLVVHRDLKPSNVLVTERDGAPRPVVLDFGIAKLLEDAEAEDPGAFPLTRTGMRLLTPAYAAPELYEPAAIVTTAADVYGLGALLYELLTGRRPHDATATGGPPTTEPTRPSRVVTEPTEARLADPATRSRALRGDLDTICLKALHPAPSRRYASAADLASDLARYLDGRPVEARPDSVGYVVGRFVQRNRSAVAAAAVAVLALVGGLGFSLVSLTSERAALAEATASADRADEAAQLLRDLFGEASPEAAAGQGDVTVREALDRGLPRVAAVEPASLRGYLLSVLGATYLSIGDFERSDSLLTASAALLEGSDAAPSVRAMNLRDLGRNRTLRGDPRGGLRFFLRADSLARRDARIDSALVFDIALEASAAHRFMQQAPEALQWAERAARLARPAKPMERGQALTALASAYLYNERTDEAVQTSRESLALYEELEGPDGASVGLASSQLAHHLVSSGRLEDALPHARRAVHISRIVYGPAHLSHYQSMGLLGQLLDSAGELEEAEAYLDSTVTIARTLPAARTATGMSMAVTLSQVRENLGDHRGAERAGRIAIEIGDSLPPEAQRADELHAMARLQTGMAMYRLGRPGARAMLERAFERVRALPPQMQDLWMQDEFISGAQQTLRTLRRGA